MIVLPSTKKKIEWSSEDAKILRDFLTSSVGQRATTLATAERPTLLDGADVNKTLVRNGEVKGFDKAIDALFSLTFEQPAEVAAPENYPDPDNDALWADGKQPTK